MDSLRTLHLTTAQELGMGEDVIASLEELLDELKVNISLGHLRRDLPDAEMICFSFDRIY